MTSLLHAQEPRRKEGPAPRTRPVHWIEGTFLLAALTCLLWVGGTYLQSFAYQSYGAYELEQEVRGFQPTLTGYLRYLISGQPGDSGDGNGSEPTAVAESARPELPGEAPARPAPAHPRNDESLIGRIEIPRLRVSAIVREGVDDKTLSRAAGHVPQTALPGEPGNFSVAAHRDTYFRGLRNIRKGDVVQVVTPAGVFKYEVDSLKIVRPENVEVLDPTPEPVVTLITCYPFNYVGSAPKRFIVRARQIAPAPSLAASLIH